MMNLENSEETMSTDGTGRLPLSLLHDTVEDGRVFCLFVLFLL